MKKQMFTAIVYKKILSKASVNIKAEGKKEAKEIAKKFLNDLDYKKQPNYEYFIVITEAKKNE